MNNNTIKSLNENIETLIKERIEKESEKQLSKIKIIKASKYDGIFSRYQFSPVLVNELRRDVNKPSKLDADIANINQDLEVLASKLKEVRANIFKEMQELERKAGKKRLSKSSNKEKVKVPFKYFRTYKECLKDLAQCENILNKITELVTKPIEVTYEIDYSKLQTLTNAEKMAYFEELALLILAEDLTDPVTVKTSRDYTINARNKEVFTTCYKEYEKLLDSELKQSKKDSLLTKLNPIKLIKNGLTNLKMRFSNDLLFRKSILAASLSFSVLGTIITCSNNAPEIFVKSENTELANFDYEKFISENKYSNSSNEILDKIVADLMNDITLEEHRKVSSTLASISESAVKTSEEDKTNLVESVEENVYEIVMVEKKLDTADESLELKSSPAEAVEALPTNHTETLFSDPILADIELKVESIKRENDEILDGCHLTYGNTTYPLNDTEFKAALYVVAHECNGTYEDAMTDASIMANRLEDPRFDVNSIMDVVSAPGQFQVWDEAAVKRFVNSYDGSQVNANVYNAVYDVFYNGIRNNDYVEFKASYSSDYTKNGTKKVQFTENGSKLHNMARSLDRVEKNNNKTLSLSKSKER